MREASGFSLLELMIVIAIVSILIAVSIPSYQIYTRRAHYMEIVEAAIPFRLGVEECFQMTGALSNCVAGKNNVPPSRHTQHENELIASIQVAEAGIITITPTTRYGITPKDTYILTPLAHQDTLIWKSSGGGIQKGYAH